MNARQLLHRTRPLAGLALVLALPCITRAWTEVPVPSSMEGVATTKLNSVMLRQIGGMNQWVIRQDELSQVPIGSVIRGIRFRAFNSTPFGPIYPNVATADNFLDFTLSSTGLSPAALSFLFSANYGSDALLVKSDGSGEQGYSIPALSFDGTNEPGQFGPVMYFARNYRYKGGNLLFEINNSNLTSAAGTTPPSFIPVAGALPSTNSGGIFGAKNSSTASGSMFAPVAHLLIEALATPLTTYGQAITNNNPASTTYHQLAFRDTFGAGLANDSTITTFNATDMSLLVPPTGRHKAVKVGTNFGAALDLNSHVVAWGHNDVGQLNGLPTDTMSAISLGPDYGLALTTTGLIRSWGNPANAAITPPTGLFKRIAAGSSYGLAISNTGALRFWGTNPRGSTVSEVPPGVFYEVATHSGIAAALKADGSVVTWGSTNTIYNPPSGTGFTALSASVGNFAALRPNGTFAVWGVNTFNQLKIPSSATFQQVESFGGGYCCLSANLSQAASGRIFYQNYAGDPTTLVTGVTITPTPSSGLPTFDLSVSNSGTFSRELDIPAGNYNLQFYCPGYLSQSQLLSVSNSGTFSMSDITLLAGDCDRNNTINITDYAILSDAFNAKSGDLNWDIRADVDGNGLVNISDYAILSDNFNKVGS